MKKTVYDAVILTDSLIGRIKNTNNDNLKKILSHLTSAKAILADMCNFLGSEYPLDNVCSESVEAGKKYDTQLESFDDLSNYNRWAESFQAAVLSFKAMWGQPKEVYEQGQIFLKKSNTCRRKILKGILITAIVIAIIAAAFAICGEIYDNDWAEKLATILGVIDFTVGIVGFSIERLSDMKVQEVRGSLTDIDYAIETHNLEKANRAAEAIKIIVAKGNGSQAAGRDAKMETRGDDSPIITGDGNSINY